MTVAGPGDRPHDRAMAPTPVWGSTGRRSAGPDDGAFGGWPPRPQLPPRGRRLWRWLALAAAGLMLVTSAAAYVAYRKLNANLTTDLTAAEELARYDAERPPPGPGRAKNVLIIGSDDPAGLTGATGGGGARSDTVILLHLAGDRRSATALSVPRDLLVDIPRCTRPGGDRTQERQAQFNSAFAYGGAACTIRTVERLTRIRIDHHMVIDFTGFRGLVDAVGGVRMCLPAALRDKHTELDLAAGCQVLTGDDALAYVRARKGIGDGSDTARIGRQQEFLGLLVAKMYSSGVLLNPTRLYPVLSTATSALTVDPGLSTLTRLYDLVREVREVPAAGIGFVTVPRESAPGQADRDVLVRPAADELFRQLRLDLPVHVPGWTDQGAGTGSR
jgi:LCP family protein required for cell wall assembly